MGPECGIFNSMTQTGAQTKGILVRIYDDEYPISTSSKADEVQRIAEYVDQKMREIAGQHAGRVPKATLAVLAAMEITGELFSTLREQSHLTEAAQENLERLSRLVDQRADLFSSLVERTTRTFHKSFEGVPELRPPVSPVR